MQIKTQTKIIVIFFLIAISLVLFYQIKRYALFKEIDKSYSASKEGTILNFNKLLKLKSGNLVNLSTDWTIWDEMVEFTKTMDKKWATKNIKPALITFDIDAIWVYNSKLNRIYSVNDLGDESLNDIPLSKEVLENIFKNYRFFNFFINTRYGLMEVHCATIHPSADIERKSNPAGLFFCGKIWDKKHVKEVEDITGTYIKIAQLTEEDVTSEKERKDGIIKFSHILKDAQQKPLAKLSIVKECPLAREMNKLAESTFFLHIAEEIIVFTALFLILIFWVNRPLGIIYKSLSEENISLLSKLKKDKTEFGLMANLIEKFFQQKKELEKSKMELSQKTNMLEKSNIELKKTINKLEETQKIALQQEKLKAVGLMASGIAHDFNNLLTPILGFSEIMLENPDILNDKEKTLNFIRLINTSSKDAADIIARLRKFYRKRSKDDKLIKVDLNKLIEEALLLTKPKWESEQQSKGINILIETDLKQISEIYVDKGEIETAIINLILNSLDAIEEDGKITISTYADDKYVTLEVSDTGKGIDKEEMLHLFEPFFSTKEDGGTGLGLPIVYGVVERHSGTIDIKSEIGKGTTFTIKLPIEEKSTNEKIDTFFEILQLNILVVDDKKAVRDTICEYLTGWGYTVETSANGKDAFEKFKVGKFDLVITDKAMPEMDGYKLTSCIKEISPQTPVIILTGFGTTIDEESEKLQEFDLMLSKPITGEKLKQAIKEVMSKKYKI